MAVNAIRRGLWAGTRRLGLDFELGFGIRYLGVKAGVRSGIMASNGSMAIQGGEKAVEGGMIGGGNVKDAKSLDGAGKRKLHGRAFYESIGSPKFVLAPMVDQSEFVRFILFSICLTGKRNILVAGQSRRKADIIPIIGLAHALPLLHSRRIAERFTGLYTDVTCSHVWGDA